MRLTRTTRRRCTWLLAAGVLVTLIYVSIRNPHTLSDVGLYSHESGGKHASVKKDTANIEGVHKDDRLVPQNHPGQSENRPGLATTQNCSDVKVQLKGKLEVDRNLPIDLAAIQKPRFPDVEAGGSWRPSCGNPDRVAVIIPFMDKYGDRTVNLAHLISHLHTVLQTHNKEYVVLVVKQNNTEFFINKGVLMNLGFEYVTQTLSFECMVFNDVDLVPTDDKTEYHCIGQPLHLAARINDEIVTYKKATGGVLSILASVFRELNGFSVRFWGWGNEDDDLASRIAKQKYTLTSEDPSKVDFVHMKHKRSYDSTNYKPKPMEHRETGLNTLHKEVDFKLLSSEKLPLCTLLTYHIAPPVKPP